MKKLLAVLALTAAAGAVPAFAGNVGVSISVGEPGFYGQLDIGGYRPRVLYDQPVVMERRYGNLAPVYLRVPRDHYQHWNRYCGRYDACARPVYFVRDDWYRDVYSPRYRQQHYARNWRDDRYDRRDNWRDDRHDRRDDRRVDRRDARHDRRDDRRDDRRNDHRDDLNRDRHNDDHRDYRN